VLVDFAILAVIGIVAAALVLFALGIF